MKIQCDRCGKTFSRRPSKIKPSNFCSRLCFEHKVTKPCCVCAKPVTRCASQMLTNACCGITCSKIYTSKRFTDLNVELNPERMIESTRTKLRISKLNTGEGKTYTKTFGRHTHRIVAEKMLGRDLLPGEVVHHIDENRRNNDPSNLRVFTTQAEHAKHHQQLKKSNGPI